MQQIKRQAIRKSLPGQLTVHMKIYFFCTIKLSSPSFFPVTNYPKHEIHLLKFSLLHASAAETIDHAKQMFN
jgi:hypothetical protein